MNGALGDSAARWFPCIQLSNHLSIHPQPSAAKFRVDLFDAFRQKLRARVLLASRFRYWSTGARLSYLIARIA
jgi:hypothetical protein